MFKGALVAHGLHDPRKLVTVINDGVDQLLNDMFSEAVVEEELRRKVIELVELVPRAAAWADRAQYPYGREELADGLAVLTGRKERQRESNGSAGGLLPVTSGVVLKKARLNRGTSSLTAREAVAYQKWSERFVQILRYSNTPAWEQAERTEDPEKFLASLMGSTRASTVSARVRAWEALGSWLRVRRSISWPREPADVVEYIWSYMREHPAPSFPRRLMAALAWMEARAGIEEGSRLSHNDLVKKVVEKTTADAEDGSMERVRAPRLPIVMVAALEFKVLDELLGMLASSSVDEVAQDLRGYAVRRLAAD